AEYTAFRDHTRSLRQLAAFSAFGALVGDDDFTDENGMAVSCNFFAVEGLDRPSLGRLFVPEDCHASGQFPVGVISESLWPSLFAADPNVIGRTAHINNRPAIVIGVVPDRTSRWAVSSRNPVGVWMPYTALQYFDPSRNLFARDEFLWLSLAGRLAPGFSRS